MSFPFRVGSEEREWYVVVGWGLEGAMVSWTSLGRKSTVCQDLPQSYLVSLPEIASGAEFLCEWQRCRVRVHTRSDLDLPHAKFMREHK